MTRNNVAFNSRRSSMTDAVEILGARQYFEELQRVVTGLSHDGIDQIADAL